MKNDNYSFFWVIVALGLWLAFLSGCDEYVQTIPESIIWNEGFHAQKYTPPRVTYVKGESCPYRPELNAIIQFCMVESDHCFNHKECDAGLTDPYYNHSFVVERSPWHLSALAHEEGHSFLFQSTGDADGDHKGVFWNTTLVETNALLESRGY